MVVKGLWEGELVVVVVKGTLGEFDFPFPKLEMRVFWFLCFRSADCKSGWEPICGLVLSAPLELKGLLTVDQCHLPDLMF